MRCCFLVIFCLLVNVSFAQRPDSVLVEGTWYFVYPIQEKVTVSHAFLDKVDLSALQFKQYSEWKKSNDPRLVLPKKTLIDSLNAELVRSKQMLSKKEDRYNWNFNTKVPTYNGFFRFRERHWYKRYPQLLVDQEIDVNYDVVPTIQNLPDGKYIQYFEPLYSYNELKRINELQTKIAAVFELKSNLLHNEFTRLTVAGDTIRHGCFEEGIKEGTWKIWSYQNLNLRRGFKTLSKKRCVKTYNQSIQLDLKNGAPHGRYFRFVKTKLVESGFFKNGYADSIWKNNEYNWKNERVVFDYSSVLDSNYQQPLAFELAPDHYLPRMSRGFRFKEKNRSYGSGISLYSSYESLYSQQLLSKLPISDFNSFFNNPRTARLMTPKAGEYEQEESGEIIYSSRRKQINFHGTKLAYSNKTKKLTNRLTYLPQLGTIVYASFYRGGQLFDTLSFNDSDSTFLYKLFDTRGKLYLESTYDSNGKLKNSIKYSKKANRPIKAAKPEKVMIIEGFKTEKDQISYSNRYRRWRNPTDSIIDGKVYHFIEWNRKTKKRESAIYLDLADSLVHELTYNEKGIAAIDQIVNPIMDSLTRTFGYSSNSVLWNHLQIQGQQDTLERINTTLKWKNQLYSGPITIQFTKRALSLTQSNQLGISIRTPKLHRQKELNAQFTTKLLEYEYMNDCFNSKKRRFRNRRFRTSKSPWLYLVGAFMSDKIEFKYIEKVSGIVRDGKPTGEWSFYSRHGKLLFSLNYENGFPTGTVYQLVEISKPTHFLKKYRSDEPYYDLYYPKNSKGKLHVGKTMQLKDGQLHGVSFTSNALGDTISVMRYYNGLLHGISQIQDHNDLLICEYNAGQRNGRFIVGELFRLGNETIQLDTTISAHFKNDLLHGAAFIKYSTYDESVYDPLEFNYRNSGYFTDYKQHTVRTSFTNGSFDHYYLQYNEEMQLQTAFTFINGKIDSLKLFENEELSYCYVQQLNDSILFEYVDEGELRSFNSNILRNYELTDKILYYDYSLEGFRSRGDYNNYGIPFNLDHYKVGTFTKFYPNFKVARTGKRVLDQSFGNWKFYDYSGNSLYEINYWGVDSLVVFQQDTFTVRGNYYEYDLTGKLISSRYLIQELEKYDCSHSDYYAIRQFITYEDPKDSIDRTNGPQRNYFDNGMLMSEGNLVNGLPQGVWQFYTPDGKLTTIGKYEKGKKEGRWLTGDLGDKKYIGEICLNPDDPQLDFHIAELERTRDIEIQVFKKGIPQLNQQYVVTD